MMRGLILVSIWSFALAGADSGIAGDWEGESICTGVRPACRNEHVIWTLKAPDRDGHVQVSADKVVNGARENMGSGEFEPDPKSGGMLWKIPMGVWKFKRTGDSIQGTLVLNDGQVARNVSMKRVTK